MFPRIDPSTVKDEIHKALEKDDSSTDKLKLLRSVIQSLKTFGNCPQLPHASTLASSGSTNKPSTAQPDLNFLMALSYAAVKSPELFTKQPSLIEVGSLCAHLPKQ